MMLLSASTPIRCIPYDFESLAERAAGARIQQLILRSVET